MNKNQSYKTGVALTILAGVIWSTVGLGIRMIEEAGVWEILLFRSSSLTCFLLFIILIHLKQNPFKLIFAVGVIPSSIGAIGLLFAYSGAIYSIQTTSVANAMLLFATAPFFAAILGRIILTEKVALRTWVAIFIAILGVVIMVSDKASGGRFWGSLAGLLSGFGFAIFSTALRWGRSQEMLPMVFLSGLFAIVITGSICYLNDISIILSENDLFITLGMGVFQVGAGLVLYTFGSRSVPAAELVLLSLAEVLLGPFWVWLFLGETFSFSTFVGGSVLLLAILGNSILGLRKQSIPKNSLRKK